MSGWVKLHRQITQWEWYQDVNTCRLFIHLLLTANHEEKRWQGTTIKRGQRIFGRNKLAEETGLTVQELRTSLDRLKSTSELTIETTNRFSIVTINRYNDFQSQEVANQQNNQQPNQQVTNKQPQLKNDKNDKKKETTTVVVSKDTDDETEKAIAKHLKSLGVSSPHAYLLKIKKLTGYNSEAIRLAWREWKSGGINSKSQFYDRCLFHAGVPRPQ